MLTKDLNDKGYLLPTTMIFISLLTIILLGLNQISRAQNIQSGLYKEAYKSRTMIEMSRNYLKDHPEEKPPLKINFNHGTVTVQDLGEIYQYTARTTTNNIIFKRSFPRPEELDTEDADLLSEDQNDSPSKDTEDKDSPDTKEVGDDGFDHELNQPSPSKDSPGDQP